MKKPKVRRVKPDSPEGQKIVSDVQAEIARVRAYKKQHGLKSMEGLFMGGAPRSVNVGE